MSVTSYSEEQVRAAEAAAVTAIQEEGVSLKLMEFATYLHEKHGIDYDLAREVVWRLTDRHILTFSPEWQVAMASTGGHSSSNGYHG